MRALPPSLFSLTLSCLTLCSLPALAADTPPPPPPQPAAVLDPMVSVRAHIAAQRWAPAVEELRKINATGDADWNNLMGYAMRKQARPDLVASQRYYDAALKINPQHAGTLEYAGELALMKGDLPTAEARLATLASTCSTPCAPLDKLKAAVASYKTTGKSTY